MGFSRMSIKIHHQDTPPHLCNLGTDEEGVRLEGVLVPRPCLPLLLPLPPLKLQLA